MVDSLDNDTRHLRLIDGGSGIDDSSMADLGHTNRRSEWFHNVRKKLESVHKLSRDWDGYGAEPISFDTVLFAFQILTEIYSTDLDVPDISPMSNEGIMIEWLVSEVEFTLEVQAPYDVTYIFESNELEEPESGSIAQEFSTLDRFVRSVIEASRGAIIAA